MGETEEIPGRILKIAQDYLGDRRIPWPVLMRIEAELVPDFHPELTDAVYDEWLALVLSSFAPCKTYRSVSLLYSVIPYPGVDEKLIRAAKSLKARVERTPSFDTRDDLKWLAAEINDRLFGWETSYKLESMDRVNRGFVEEVLRRVDKDPRIQRRSRRKSEASDGEPAAFLERLPKPLWDFAQAVSARYFTTTDSVFWDAVREYVYPHFSADAMDREEYRSYLALAIRHYGLAQDSELLPEASKLLAKLRSQPSAIAPQAAQQAGISAELLSAKVEDLIAAARRACGRGRAT